MSDVLRLKHILEAIDRVERSLSRVTLEDFLKNEDKKWAIISHLTVIGEAANNLEKALRRQYPSNIWNDAILLRHSLVHEYFRISDEEIWTTATKTLPKIKQHIVRVLTMEQKKSKE